MADQYLGEIRIVGFNFPPNGWALCNGQILPISQNTALFSLLGTFYGGDGKSNFALPNLQGNAALGFGQGAGLSLYSLGQTVGQQSVTLNVAQLGAHNHTPVAESGRGIASQATPVGNAWGKSGAGDTPYSSGPANVTMSAASTAAAGSGGAHNNMMPYLVVNYVIAMTGIYPPRS
jgi:microcystin-dependent protein